MDQFLNSWWMAAAVSFMPSRANMSIKSFKGATMLLQLKTFFSSTHFSVMCSLVSLSSFYVLPKPTMIMPIPVCDAKGIDFCEPKNHNLPHNQIVSKTMAKMTNKQSRVLMHLLSIYASSICFYAMWKCTHCDQN
jgi:hypothetical protein